MRCAKCLDGCSPQMQETWSEDDAAKLLGDFVAAVTPSLLFQQHLRRVRVVCFEADATQPYLLAQVGCRASGNRSCDAIEGRMQLVPSS